MFSWFRRKKVKHPPHTLVVLDCRINGKGKVLEGVGQIIVEDHDRTMKVILVEYDAKVRLNAKGHLVSAIVNRATPDMSGFT